MEIEWEEPPPVALARMRTPGRYVDWAYALRDHPGRWAKLPPGADGARSVKTAQNLAQSIRRGTTAGFGPRNSYEAVADEGHIWVRYIPPEDQQPAEPTEPPPPPADEGASSSNGTATDEVSVGGQVAQPQSHPDPAAVRAWARNNGFNVPDKGRLPDELVAAYRRAHAPHPPRPLGADVHS